MRRGRQEKRIATAVCALPRNDVQEGRRGGTRGHDPSPLCGAPLAGEPKRAAGALALQGGRIAAAVCALPRNDVQGGGGAERGDTTPHRFAELPLQGSQSGLPGASALQGGGGQLAAAVCALPRNDVQGGGGAQGAV